MQPRAAALQPDSTLRGLAVRPACMAQLQLHKRPTLRGARSAASNPNPHPNPHPHPHPHPHPNLNPNPDPDPNSNPNPSPNPNQVPRALLGAFSRTIGTRAAGREHCCFSGGCLGQGGHGCLNLLAPAMGAVGGSVASFVAAEQVDFCWPHLLTSFFTHCLLTAWTSAFGWPR